jgi:hypothetical protein
VKMTCEFFRSICDSLLPVQLTDRGLWEMKLHHQSCMACQEYTAAKRARGALDLTAEERAEADRITAEALARLNK